MALRKGQRELVEQYRGGYSAVPAIPGGGKTHCLTVWASEIIKQGLHKPGKILIVTYMNSAVNNFKQRIARELEAAGINGSRDYHVSTIHGLCLQIIREKPGLANINEEFDIIDGSGKLYIISSAVEEWKKTNESVFRHFLDEKLLSAGRQEKIENDWHERFCGVMSAAIGDFKSRGMAPEEASRLCRRFGNDSFLKAAAAVYGTYDKKLKAAGMVDFDDMLHKAKKMLTDDESLLERYRKRYTFVCEDEAQDSNLLQNEILALIANGNFLRVGDSNQAICSTFTNSDFIYFKNFCEMPQTTVYNITQSSRSTKDVIDAANYFVKYVAESHPVQQCRGSLLPQYIEPVGEEDERKNPVIGEYGIRYAFFKSWEEEAEGLVRYARHMLRNHPGKSAAILIPTGWKIRDVAALLTARGIPCEELEGGSFAKTRALRLLGRVLDFRYSPDDSRKFADLAGELSSSADQQKKKLLLDYIMGNTVESILYPAAGIPDKGDVPDALAQTEEWREFTSGLELFRELLELSAAPVEQLMLQASSKLGFDREEKAIAQRVAGDIKFMSLRKPGWQLSDLADELLSPRSMYGYFAGMVWDLKGYEPKPGVVALSTYHKSKGLEWDIVFLAGLSFSDFPVSLDDRFAGEYWFLRQQYKNPQALMKADMEKLTGTDAAKDSILAAKLETISERARLLYVGITRAREYLFLSGFHENQGKRNEVRPSLYLMALKNFIDGRAAKQ